MSFARPAVFALCVAVATSALCATPPQYSQVRHDHPGIDDAVAAMPNSDFNGTINRLSALWNRAQVRDLGAGAGTNGQLPENFLRNLDATLADLAADLREDELGTKDAAGALSDTQVAWVFRVVEVYAFKRSLEFYAGNAFTDCSVIIPCTPTPEHVCPPPCVDDDPAIYDRLDSILGALRGPYARLRAGNPAYPSSINGNNFLPVMGGTFLTIKGVESIDD